VIAAQNVFMRWHQISLGMAAPVDSLRSNRVLRTRLRVQRWKHYRAFLSFDLRPKSKPPASRAVVKSDRLQVNQPHSDSEHDAPLHRAALSKI